MSSLQEGWDSFFSIVYAGSTISKEQTNQLKQAFIAGALSNIISMTTKGKAELDAFKTNFTVVPPQGGNT